MTELHGALDAVDLPGWLRLLASLRKTGRLRVRRGRWSGEVLLQDGEVAAAVLGTEHGLAALEAIVQALPGAEFSFSDGEGGGPGGVVPRREVELPAEELASRLEQLAALAVAAGAPRLRPEAVPQVANPAEWPADVLIDRATLRTLLAVDGRRTVDEIVAHRGLPRALAELARLADLGLVRLAGVSPAPVAPQTATPLPAPQALHRPPAGESEPTGTQEGEPSAGACPRLGFLDDPSSRFSRPTHLHRCYAAETPERLSTHVQRELCLTDRFPACQRYITGAAEAPAAIATPLEPTPSQVGSRVPPAAERPAPLSERPEQDARGSERIRERTDRALPLAAAPAPRLREQPLLGEGQVAASAVPMHQQPRSEMVPGGSAGSLPPRPGSAVAAAPRWVRPAGGPPAGGPAVTSGWELWRERGRAAVRASWWPLALAATAPLLLAAALGLWLLRTSDGAGPGLFPAPPAVATARRVVSPVVAGPARPTLTDQALTATTAAAGARASTPQAVRSPSPAVLAGRPSVFRVLLDERFAAAPRGWPNDAQSIAWFADGAYRLATRQPGRFVALSAPALGPLGDVVVSGRFRKVGGPAGGGYGLVVRDQASPQRDGLDQGGQFYVFEVGDQGEIGAWRRDGDRWVDLQPWTRSEAVRPGAGVNQLTVQAVGPQFTFLVNGTQVTRMEDATLREGAVGVFVGGDGNQVVLERLAVQVPQ